MTENGKRGRWLRWATASVRSHVAEWQQARAERAEMHERESLNISRWLAEKAPTQAELYEQQYIDGLKALALEATQHTGTITGDNIIAGSIEIGNLKMAPGSIIWDNGEGQRIVLAQAGHEATTPISSARSAPTRETVEEKIKRMTTKVEPEWDVASMIDAHRNGCTALERPVHVFEDDDPVWRELTAQKWDPTHEMGPRERDYIRKQAKR